MKIKAKFKGKDGSVGYRNGENYNLFLRLEKQGPNDILSIKDIIKEDGGTISFRRDSDCEYQSLRAFLNNWQVF